jgi:phage terminase small subunit
MRGRKPKPTHLKLLEGNPGKRPINTREPKPEIRVPTCPAHLCPSAKAEWKRLAQQLVMLGVITELDRAVLAAYCQAYGRWVEAERKLKETPMLLKLPSGAIQQSPWLAISNKHWS